VTTYAWPPSRHFVPATHELRVVDNTQRTAESALSGYVQTTGMPGARWGWGMDFAPHTQAQRAEVEAYLLRLSGRQHRVQLWDLRNPRPRGNITLAGVTLGASAAQFATSLTLAGCVGRDGVLNGSFETDSNADNLADGWALFVGGAGDGGRTYTRSRAPTAPATHGTAARNGLPSPGGRSNRSPSRASHAISASVGLTPASRNAASVSASFGLSGGHGDSIGQLLTLPGYWRPCGQMSPPCRRCIRCCCGSGRLPICQQS
jgi:hypothetical protein